MAKYNGEETKILSITQTNNNNCQGICYLHAMKWLESERPPSTLMSSKFNLQPSKVSTVLIVNRKSPNSVWCY